MTEKPLEKLFNLIVGICLVIAFTPVLFNYVEQVIAETKMEWWWVLILRTFPFIFAIAGTYSVLKYVGIDIVKIVTERRVNMEGTYPKRKISPHDAREILERELQKTEHAKVEKLEDFRPKNNGIEVLVKTDQGHYLAELDNTGSVKRLEHLTNVEFQTRLKKTYRIVEEE